jgi:hypothetical protein
MNTKTCMKLLALLCALLAAAAHAQTYPSRPLRVLSGAITKTYPPPNNVWIRPGARPPGT